MKNLICDIIKGFQDDVRRPENLCVSEKIKARQ